MGGIGRSGCAITCTCIAADLPNSCNRFDRVWTGLDYLYFAAVMNWLKASHQTSAVV